MKFNWLFSTVLLPQDTLILLCWEAETHLVIAITAQAQFSICRSNFFSDFLGFALAADNGASSLPAAAPAADEADIAEAEIGDSSAVPESVSDDTSGVVPAS